MPSQNTLDLAKQGDPEAISTILTYHLTQRYNMTASAIRLGDYLSVLVEASFAPDRSTMVRLVQDIVQSLVIEAIATIEISARQIGDRAVLWSQTIELLSEHYPMAMNDETLASKSVSADISALETTSAETAIAHSTPDTTPPLADSGAVIPVTAAVPQKAQTETLVPAAPQTTPVATSPNSSTSQEDEWNEILNKLMERPEMLAIVTFALVIVCWNAYIEWMTEADPSQSISGVKLARRLGVNHSTLDRHKARPDFSPWSQDLDPDGIAWSYENNRFIPQVGTKK